ncbi:hypothetical protein MHU86_15824 [Fragilaria crotonensis]|nr:hypothetical protein MHU86_15824 [Fragilaria crotonensis]
MRYHRSLSKDEGLKLCPCCKAAEEDKTHFYRCRSNSSLIPGLEKLRKDGSRLAHPLRQILSDGIRHWIDTGTSNFRVDTTTYPAHMEEAIRTIVREQERIGWDNALHGLLSKAWTDLASLSYDRDTRSLRDGEVQMRRCLEALHDFSVGLWKSRNSALHHSDDKKTQLLKSTTIEKNCTSISAVGSDMF